MVRTLVRGRGRIIFALILAGLLSLPWVTGCGSGNGGSAGAGTSSSIEGDGSVSGDVEAKVGETVKASNVRVTVNALQATFQPVLPAQRVSGQTPSTPAAGEAFYQAYVRVENTGVSPVRADPADFTCVIGSTVVAAEATRSGPCARSLLKNASLDLILTYETQAGLTPELCYSPSWYDGVIRVSPIVGNGGDDTEDVTSSTE